MRRPFLIDWVLEHAGRRPDAPAIATPTTRLTYGELATRVQSLAGHVAAAGVSAGDRVLTALPNTPATVVASLALNLVGAIPVEVNRDWNAEILAGIIRRSVCRHAFVWGRDVRTWGRVLRLATLERLWVVHGAALAAEFLGELRDTTIMGVLDDGRVDPAAGAAPEAHRPSVDAESPAVVLCTSGSTGQPRGVIQSHANIDANTRSIVEYLHLGEDDRALLILPLYYCYGRSVLQTHLFAGGSVFLDGRFAFPRVVLEALDAEQCTGFAGVPLTFEIIRRQVDVRTLRFRRLRYLTQAGGAMAPETISWVRTAFHPAQLFVMYGQTEATSRLSYLPPERSEHKESSIGVPIPGVTLAVVDDAGRELPPGVVGHLVARGPNVTLGYLDDAEATAAILRDGWLWTGDLARRDADGFFFHEGRSKEILKIGGRRVSPTEIEQVVQRFPGIAEVAVVGVPDALRGEVPVALLVTARGHALDEAALRRYCCENMASYRVPAQFTVVQALPRNAAGKLLRAELAALHRSVHLVRT